VSTPELQLVTLYETDATGRLTTTREPARILAPIFVLIRSSTATAYGIRTGIPDAVADELTVLACDEAPIRDLRDLPKHVDRYRALGTTESFGPAFEFPSAIAAPSDIVVVEDERALDVNFRGWAHGEIAAGCAPVMAIVVDGRPVSICFCARRSDVAAEAGVDTAAAYRGRGMLASSLQRGHSQCARPAAHRSTARVGRIPHRSRSRASSGSSRTPAPGTSHEPAMLAVGGFYG
jgi:hypothetical protein